MLSKFKNLLNKYREIQDKLDKKTEEKRLNKQICNDTPPYTHCLNCGSELQGMYCHKCGQQADDIKPRMKSFVWEYLADTYPLDTQILPTLYNLVRRPGYITNEFLAGKYKSYVHPLKLHLLFIFIILTLMVLFPSGKKVGAILDKYTSTEILVPMNSLSEVEQNVEQSERAKNSSKERVQLQIPVELTEIYPEFFSNVEVVSNTESNSIDTLYADVPVSFIEDGVLVGSQEEGYKIAHNNDDVSDWSVVQSAKMAWKKTSDFITQYVPLLIIFLIPLVAFATQLLNRRKKRPYMHYFVFTLHYSAFLELFLFAIFIIVAITGKVIPNLGWILFILTSIYLSIALMKAIGDKYYILSLIKAMLINAFYISLILVFLSTTFLISLISVLI